MINLLMIPVIVRVGQNTRVTGGGNLNQRSMHELVWHCFFEVDLYTCQWEEINQLVGLNALGAM